MVKRVSTGTGTRTQLRGDGAGGLAEARALLAGMRDRPWGQVSPSVYETARLVSLAPWLTGHARRVDFLVSAQRPDGGWGAPGGYSLVPTLSATDALLSVLPNGARADDPGGSVHSGEEALRRVAGKGLRALSRMISALDAATIPDMPAIDIIAASLIGSINQRLDAQDGAPHDGPAPWPDGGRLELPAGLDGARLAAVHALLRTGAELPEKLLHALEVAGGRARGARVVRPGPAGAVGASPAATAAWLDETSRLDRGDAARCFLEAVASDHGGPVPCGIPITVFERAWVLTNLARAGLALDVPGELVESLRPALDPGGVAAGEGLPADADTTSVALYALGLLGEPFRPDSLWRFRLDTHFCTWPGEDGFSVSTNAHVLEAFGLYVARCPDASPRYAAVVTELSALLRHHQRSDGGWSDRWHASPYYATACCALALARFGGDGSAAVVRAAVRWVLATQRADGSWGRWQGTEEETAYALHVLTLTRIPGEQVRTAIARGRAYLLRAAGQDGSEQPGGPALWHDKDLYRPVAIVRAGVLAALKLARDLR